jgi:hypothetical protein
MLFNLVLDWVLRKTEVDLSGTLLYKSVQIEGYVGDQNTQGRSSTAVGVGFLQLEVAAKQTVRK